MDTQEKLVSLGRKLLAAGLVVGAGGNLSIREGEYVYMTPSGFALGELIEDDLVQVDIETGDYTHEMNRPTCEYLMHIEIYRKRPDVEVVVHGHPIYVIGICSSGNTIRPVTADAAAFLHPIKQIPYIVPGGKELADAVLDALDQGECNVLIFENHGAITLGGSCREAFMRMELLEGEAMIQFVASSSGTPKFLTEEQIAEINSLSVEKYRKKLAAEEEW